MNDFITDPCYQSCIVVADDDIKITRTVERILRREGYHNLILSNESKEVVALCQDYSPELLILDLHMPGISGYEILESLRSIDSDFALPVMVLSGETCTEQRVRALSLGAMDLVTKPVDFELVARVRNLLGRRRLMKDLITQNHSLEERVREGMGEVREAHLETVLRLGLAAEYRDDETGQHVCRICRYTKVMALALGEPEDKAELMGLAAKLHDIGKLGIPDSVLLKPGKLTDSEFELMKKHTVIGASILSNANSRLLKLAEQIALNHHEKWDGSGYPGGLKGEEIPLPARAVAVCDVFDALVSERPYKRSWPLQEAVNYLKEQSGKHFDPAMVDLFVELLPVLHPQSLI